METAASNPHVACRALVRHLRAPAGIAPMVASRCKAANPDAPVLLDGATRPALFRSAFSDTPARAIHHHACVLGNCSAAAVAPFVSHRATVAPAYDRDMCGDHTGRYRFSRRRCGCDRHCNALVRSTAVYLPGIAVTPLDRRRHVRVGRFRGICRGPCNTGRRTAARSMAATAAADSAFCRRLHADNRRLYYLLVHQRHYHQRFQRYLAAERRAASRTHCSNAACSTSNSCSAARWS